MSIKSQHKENAKKSYQGLLGADFPHDTKTEMCGGNARSDWSFPKARISSPPPPPCQQGATRDRVNGRGRGDG
jgi:hypothetical protein